MKKLNTILTSIFILFQIANCTLNIDNCKAQWIQQPVPNNTGLLLSIDFVNPDAGVSCGWYNFMGRALYTTNAGSSWISSSVPDSSRSLVSVEMIDSLTGYISGAYNLPGERNLNFSTDQFLKKGFTYKIIKDMENIGQFRGLNAKGLLLKTTDGGRNWLTYGSLNPEIYYLTWMDFIDANTGVVLADNRDNLNSLPPSILKTTNGGLTWVEIFRVDSVLALNSIEFLDNDNIIATGYGGSYDTSQSNLGGMIFKSTNGGNSWALQFFLNKDMNDISFTDLSTGFITSRSPDNIGIYKTTNMGVNWNINLNYNNDTMIFNGVKFYQSSGTGMVYGNIFTPKNTISFTQRTTDYGNTWGNIQILDSNLLIGGTMLSRENQYLSGGNPFDQAVIFHTTNGGTVSINESGNSVPGEFALSQNYPNPFNPRTIINYELGITNEVTLKVYNILGNEVLTLVEGKQNAGTYSVNFDGSNFASGVYFYSLFRDGILADTKSMMLVK